MIEPRKNDISAEVISSLDLSTELIAQAEMSSDKKIRDNLIWKAYSNAELAIGLSKLAFEELNQLGSLRPINELQRKTKKDPINLILHKSRELLEQSKSAFQIGDPVSALEFARKGRDLLKTVFLRVERDRRSERAR